MRETLADGGTFSLRGYQSDAIEAFYAGGSEHGGSGVVVLPCGAGKTIVGMGALAAVGKEALVLTTNVTALRQWRRELLEKTTLTEEQVGEYSGEFKQIRQVTLSTYQMLTYRKSKADDFKHFKLFSENPWGLIIYDEVPLLPAPVFRFTAEIQATRRLGLTATLIREDGKEKEVFSLIGPRKYDVPWRSLEGGGWIADAECIEVRVELDPDLKEGYQIAGRRGKFRIASENPAKMEAIRNVLASRGRTPAQGALCWLWAKSPVMIPIPGFKTVAQVQENAGAMSFGPLNDGEMKEIDALLERTESA